MRDDRDEPLFDDAAMLASLESNRRDFLALVEDIRPDLHRYCARMTGSVADGEDVVQDTLARAYYELPELREIPPLRPWLFKIAHNRAIDFHRRAAYRTTASLDEAEEVLGAFEAEPEQRISKAQAVQAAVSVFMMLRPSQRACVVLVDVLEYTLEETAEHLDMTVAAVKAALHRGRVALRGLVEQPQPAPEVSRPSSMLSRYVALFNAHDWDGVRGMLAEDVRLDLVSRRRSIGAAAVGLYFSNYERVRNWRAEPAWMDGHEVIAFFNTVDAKAPDYFVRIEFVAGRVSVIRDYRHVPYIGRDLQLSLCG
jgi:RNA polymerase sigma factor (sigma-70 family)